MTALTFLIPVRHPNNSPDWSRLKANLEQTIASIAGQTHHDWRAVIIANAGSDLPALPAQVEVEWVDFSPNVLHDKGTASRDEVLDAFRMDKGRRVLKGMLRARDSRFFMIVDDDDFEVLVALHQQRIEALDQGLGTIPGGDDDAGKLA